MSQPSPRTALIALALLVGSMWSCTDDPITPEPSNTPTPSFAVTGFAPPPPPGLVSVGSLELWPWTGLDLEGTSSDPINLVFAGEVDVLSLRAALLSLDGDRTAYAFPDQYPFNCTWSDAHGGVQTAYTDGAGWVASAIQLQCGNYDPVRFHIRLFDAGDYVVAGAHFDLLIPNTPQHQVLGWELPQQLVTVDLIRSGLLGAFPGGAIVNTPGYVQAIPQPIYNAVPDALKVALGFPPGPTSDPAVPIPDDGVATVLTLAARAPVTEGSTQYEASLPFDLVVPRPFCSQGPLDYVLIQGPVHISVSTRVNAMGMFESHNTLRGDLRITPIDVTTGQPSGETFPAQISEIDNARVGPDGTSVNAIVARKALPPGVGFLKTHLVTSQNGAARFVASEKCD